MLIRTSTIMAFRCLSCGRMEFFNLAMFSFGNERSVGIKCTCGASLMHFSTRDRSYFQMQGQCAMCEMPHFWRYHWRRIWSPDLIELKCLDTDLEIGFIGPRDKVTDRVKQQNRSLGEMTAQLGVAGYFKKWEVMEAVLEKLYAFAEVGRLSCQCRNHNLEMEVFPDRVELRCPDCRSGGAIRAESDQDRAFVYKIHELKLTSEGLCFRGPGLSRHWSWFKR